MERGFFEKLSTAKDRSPEENLGTIAAWRQYIQQNRGSYADAFPGLAKPEHRKVFGKDAESVFGQEGGASGSWKQEDIVQTGIDTEGKYGPKGGKVGKKKDGTIVPLGQ